jgi:predicted dehydrogenase
MAKLRLVQVGLGFWGFDWATEVLPRVREVEPVGYVDPDRDALGRVGAALGVLPELCFPSLADALARTGCDAVLASLPTAFHVPVARAALEAGKHVIVEKPFAPTLEGAAGLVRLAEERGLTLMVSQNYRHYPASIAAADLVASGALGRPLEVAVDFRRNALVEGYRYWDIPDPLLADMSIHHFDLMRFVLGLEPAEVSCRTWNHAGSPFSADPCGAATILFEGGVAVSYRGSWLSRGPATTWSGDWAMDLEEGGVAWACRGSKAERAAGERLDARRLDGTALEAPDLALPEYHDRAGALATFARAVLDGAEPPRFSSGRDNLASLAMVEACCRSASLGGAPVRLDEVLPPGFGGKERA